MSRSSFPRPEHVAALQQKIEERVRLSPLTIEVAERGLNHYRCQYRFRLRRRPGEEWVELGIHFQLADRMETTGSDAELNRIVDEFVNRHFAEKPGS